MQTVVPTAVNAASMVVIYLAEVLVCGLLERRNPQQAGELYLNLVVLAMSQVFLMVYSGLCYKHFVLATLLFIPVMVNWMWEGWGNRMHIWLQGLDMTFGRAVLTGFCLIAAWGWGPGYGDAHMVPSDNGFPWKEFMRVLKSSVYEGPLMLEVGMAEDETAEAFLKRAMEAGNWLDSLS